MMNELDLSMSERIPLGNYRATLELASDGGDVSVFFEMDDPGYTDAELAARVPEWIDARNVGNGLVFTADPPRMRELVGEVEKFFGPELRTAGAAGRETAPPPRLR